MHTIKPLDTQLLNELAAKGKPMITVEEHMVNGVNFYEEVKQMIADGYDTFIEIGEVSVLAAMVKSVDRSLNIIHIKDEESFEKLGELWIKQF